MSSLIPAVMVPAFIPSPSQGVWHIVGLPIRAYALCILAGIFAGYWLGRHRWVARGGSPTVLADIMFWAIPFGLVGARIYHVITDAELYFGEGRHPIDALKIWHGGLGIWGAVGFGALGAWIACRRAKVPFLAVADAMAPGIALAQVFGRFGNYFNQELFGKPTDQAVGPGDRARAPPGRVRRLRHLPPDVPVRSDLEPRRGRAGHPGRPPLQARPRPRVLPLRGRLHRWAAPGSRTCASTRSTTSSASG